MKQANLEFKTSKHFVKHTPKLPVQKAGKKQK